MPIVKNQIAPTHLRTVFTFEVPRMLSYAEHRSPVDTSICMPAQMSPNIPRSSPFAVDHETYAAEGITAAIEQNDLAIFESGLTTALLPLNMPASASCDFSYFLPKAVEEAISLVVLTYFSPGKSPSKMSLM